MQGHPGGSFQIPARTAAIGKQFGKKIKKILNISRGLSKFPIFQPRPPFLPSPCLQNQCPNHRNWKKNEKQIGKILRNILEATPNFRFSNPGPCSSPGLVYKISARTTEIGKQIEKQIGKILNTSRGLSKIPIFQPRPPFLPWPCLQNQSPNHRNWKKNEKQIEKNIEYFSRPLQISDFPTRPVFLPWPCLQNQCPNHRNWKKIEKQIDKILNISRGLSKIPIFQPRPPFLPWPCLQNQSPNRRNKTKIKNKLEVKPETKLNHYWQAFWK